MRNKYGEPFVDGGLDLDCDGAADLDLGAPASCVPEWVDDDGSGSPDGVDADCDGVIDDVGCIPDLVDTDGDGVADAIDADCDGAGDFAV